MQTNRDYLLDQALLKSSKRDLIFWKKFYEGYTLNSFQITFLLEFGNLKIEDDDKYCLLSTLISDLKHEVENIDSYNEMYSPLINSEFIVPVGILSEGHAILFASIDSFYWGYDEFFVRAGTNPRRVICNYINRDESDYDIIQNY